jgi:hypothetical protein
MKVIINRIIQFFTTEYRIVVFRKNDIVKFRPEKKWWISFGVFHPYYYRIGDEYSWETKEFIFSTKEDAEQFLRNEIGVQEQTEEVLDINEFKIK